MLFAYQVGPELGEFSLTKAGEPVAQLLGSNKSQDGVAQELHLLIVAHSGAAGCLQCFQLPRLRTMGQGLLQQLWPLEAVAQSCLQLRDVPRLHDCGDRRRTSDFGPRQVPEAGVRGLMSEVRGLVFVLILGRWVL